LHHSNASSPLDYVTPMVCEDLMYPTSVALIITEFSVF
jgi:hypothetical protein